MDSENTPVGTKRKKLKSIIINPAKKQRTDYEYEYGMNKSIYDVKSIDDLIDLGMCYKADDNEMFKKLFQLIPALTELNEMVGMNSIKRDIINQVIYFIQGYGSRDNDGHLLHCVIYGSPGYGKTMVATIIGKIYKSLGYLSGDKITYARRDTLIAKYLGQTAIKTRALLEEAKGGVLIIDEVYSLGSANEGSGDSFSKECIDTINQYLSENKDDLLCIVVGYKDEVNKCFFSVNDGLERRFPFRYTIEKYTVDEMIDIFFNQVDRSNWSIWNLDKCREILKEFIDNKIDVMFENAGGDTENLFFICKTCRAMNTFGRVISNENEKFMLEEKDIRDGLIKFKEGKEYKKNEKMSDEIRFKLYT